ncbi:uncharacterized protein LOC111135241 isoform X2 [Crassostrea virginica]
MTRYFPGGDGVDLGWIFQGPYLRHHEKSYLGGDNLSGSYSESSSESRCVSRRRLVWGVSIGLFIIFISIICVVIYLADLRDYKTRYYTSTGSMKIVQPYSPELADKKSPAYKSLASQFCSQMGQVFAENNFQAKSYRLCEITSMRPGSIIISFIIYFDTTYELTNTGLMSTIHSSLREVNSQHVFGDFVVDRTAITLSTTLSVYEDDPLPPLESSTETFIPPTTTATTSVMETTSTIETTTSIIETTTSTMKSTTSPMETTTPTMEKTSTTSTTKPTTSPMETTTSAMETTTPTMKTTTAYMETTSTTPAMEKTSTTSTTKPTTTPMETTTSAMETTTTTMKTTTSAMETTSTTPAMEKTSTTSTTKPTTSPMETTTSAMETTTPTMKTTTSAMETTSTTSAMEKTSTTSMMKPTISPMETTTTAMETTSTTSALEKTSTTSTMKPTTSPMETTTPPMETTITPTMKPTSSAIETTTSAMKTTSTTVIPSTVSTSPISSTTPETTTTKQLTSTTTAYLFHADVLFPSITVLAGSNTSLECNIYVNSIWDTVTLHQDSVNGSLLLAVYSSNGTATYPVENKFVNVTFERNSDGIRVFLIITLQAASSCPSLLHFTCGITMADTFRSSFTNTSALSITAPVYNVTLDMDTVYYAGQRLELTCRTITDLEYGDVFLEVRNQNSNASRETALRSMYASTRKEDCSVNFEWTYRSNFSLDPSLNGSIITCLASNKLLQQTSSDSKKILVITTETTTTTEPFTSSTTTLPFHADVLFPSMTVLAGSNASLECNIYVNNSWDKVTLHQNTVNGSLLVAVYSSNGTRSFPGGSNFLNVAFDTPSDGIRVLLNISLHAASSCPSLLQFTCGITMADTLKSSFTNTSSLSITAPVHNVTLDMDTVYYAGQRLELTCRTITDLEYGDVFLEVRTQNFNASRETALRSMYSSTRKEDCSVDFEWTYRSNFSLVPSLNGSIITCLASNKLLQETFTDSKTVLILTTDVSFEQYSVSGTVGQSVTVKCQTSIPDSVLDSLVILKTSNSTNVTVASYSNGNVTNPSGTSVSFQDGVLTMEFLSLQCYDEGQYLCVVHSGNSEVTSPLPLTLQPTVIAGHIPVSLVLNVDIVENTFRHTSIHSCSGEIGYPDADGLLSLTFTDSSKGKTVTYNEKNITESMKVKGESSVYSYSVTLAEDFQILVLEDRKVRSNCSTVHTVRFYLRVSRAWNMGMFRCEVVTNKGLAQSSVKAEQFYVISGDACDQSNTNTNQSVVFIDHEIQDNCNTYIQCGKDGPYGSKCNSPSYCAYIGKAYCDDCSRATCSEKASTTNMPTSTTESTPVSEYMSCNSTSVYEGESALISCFLFTSSFTSLNLSREESAIGSVVSNGTELVSPAYQGKFDVLYTSSSPRVDITIHSMSCFDQATYTVKMYLGTGNVTSTTFRVIMKVKPGNPKLTLHPDLLEGQNDESHYCTGEVGRPPGNLEIQIKRSSDSDFTRYRPPNQKTTLSMVNSENCSSVTKLTFSVDLTSDRWTNVTVRCVVSGLASSNHTLGPQHSSSEYIVSSIPSDFCTNKTGDYYDYHPQGCPFYVRCVDGRPYGQVCAAQSLCMNPKIGTCLSIT